VGDCVSAGQDSWVCDADDDLDLAGECDRELQCMVLCGEDPTATDG